MENMKIYKMEMLSSYQAGSIVSRMIFNKKSGSVTFFAFDKDQNLSEHITPFDALAYILKGEAEMVISGEKFILKEGEMIIMPANKPHSVRAIKKFKMILTMIKS